MSNTNLNAMTVKRQKELSALSALGIFAHDALSVRVWEILLVVLVLYQVLAVPFVWAYWSFVPDRVARRMDYIELGLDVIFLADVLLQFNISRLVPASKPSSHGASHGAGAAGEHEHEGSERQQMTRGEIARAYLTRWFCVDVGACVALVPALSQLVAGGGMPAHGFRVAEGLRLLRLLRALKLKRILETLDVGEDIHRWLLYSRYSHLLRLSQYLVVLTVTFHYIACAWHRMGGKKGRSDRTWLEYQLRSDYGALTTGFAASGASELLYDALDEEEARTHEFIDDAYRRYVTCFMIVVRMMIGGELEPLTNEEKLLGSVFTMMGSIMMAITYGQVAVLIHSFYSNATRYRNKMESLWHEMQRLKLPHELKNRVYKYYDFLNTTHGCLDGQVNSFIPELNSNLGSEVLLYLRVVLITNVPFFRVCHVEVLRAIIMNLEDYICLPKDIVVKEGETGREMYFIREGMLKVMVRRPKQKPPLETVLDENAEGDGTKKRRLSQRRSSDPLGDRRMSAAQELGRKLLEKAGGLAPNMRRASSVEPSGSQSSKDLAQDSIAEEDGGADTARADATAGADKSASPPREAERTSPPRRASAPRMSIQGSRPGPMRRAMSIRPTKSSTDRKPAEAPAGPVEQEEAIVASLSRGKCVTSLPRFRSPKGTERLRLIPVFPPLVATLARSRCSCPCRAPRPYTPRSSASCASCGARCTSRSSSATRSRRARSPTISTTN